MEPEQQGVRVSDYADGDEEVGEATTEREEQRGCRDEELGPRIRKERFLTAHNLGMSVADAARAAGVDRRTIYRWRDKDPEFAKEWREARESLVEDLEMEAYNRAFKGNDRLLMFLLRSYKPVTYNPRQREGKPWGAKAAHLELANKVREWM